MLLQYFKLATQLFHWHIFFGRACDMVDVDIFMSDNILLGVSSSVTMLPIEYSSHTDSLLAQKAWF